MRVAETKFISQAEALHVRRASLRLVYVLMEELVLYTIFTIPIQRARAQDGTDG